MQEKSLTSLVAPLVFPTESDAFNSAADLLVSTIQNSIRHKGSCVVIVAGGKSTTAVMHVALAQPVDWSMVNIIVADERCVPESHPDRNDASIRQIFTSANLGVEPIVNSIHAELPPAECLANFESLLNTMGSPDISLVGIADDGHLASLFPNSAGLTTSQNAVFVDNSPKSPKNRISCSMGYLTRATYRIALQTGHNKRDIFVRLQQGERLPLALFSPTHWFMDNAAAH